MNKEEIIRRCKLMPKEGGYARSEIEPICKQLKIDTKQNLPELRKSIVATLSSPIVRSSSPITKEEIKDISDFSVKELKKRTKDKIILSFAGCFCPPHVGHYNMVDTAISKIKPDIVQIQIVNSNEDTRHGTPLEHSIQTWKKWGKVLSEKYGVDMYVSHFFQRNLLLYDGGAEFIKAYIQANVWEGEQMPKEYRRNPLQQKSLDNMVPYFLKGVPRDFKGYYAYHIQREGDLSATNFIKCLKDLEMDCLMYVPNDVKDKKAYINEIREKYYNELK